MCSKKVSFSSLHRCRAKEMKKKKRTILFLSRFKLIQNPELTGKQRARQNISYLPLFCDQKTTKRVLGSWVVNAR